MCLLSFSFSYFFLLFIHSAVQNNCFPPKVIEMGTSLCKYVKISWGKKKRGLSCKRFLVLETSVCSEKNPDDDRNNEDLPVADHL